MHTVKDVMTRDPVCCSGTESVQEIAQIMQEESCGEVLIADDEKHPVGVVTDRDIVVRVIAQGEDPIQYQAQDIMTKGVETIDQNATTQECFEKMHETKLRRLPVVNDQNECIGIISRADLDHYLDEIETSNVIRKISQASQRVA